MCIAKEADLISITLRWDVILETLSIPIKNSRHLENAIQTYNKGNWDFGGLREYFRNHVYEDERDKYFEEVIPVNIDWFDKKVL